MTATESVYPHGTVLCRHMVRTTLQRKTGSGIGWSGCHSKAELPSLSRDLPVVFGVAVSPNFRSGWGPWSPHRCATRDMHVSLSLLLVSAP